jgi:hypothetical protein
MKKVDLLKSMSNLGTHAWSPVRSPARDTFARSKSTRSVPALSETESVDILQLEALRVQVSKESA